MIKSLDEIEQIIEMMFQEKDISQKTKSKHMLKHQFRMALEKIATVERTNNMLRSELGKNPEYQKEQFMKAISPYFNI